MAAGAPYACDGVLVRLFAVPGRSLAAGPGQLGRDAGAAMLFQAGAAIWTLDLFAAFWREEAAGLDWRHDFLRDPDTDALLDGLADPPDEEEEEPEMLYTKSQLTTLGSDVID